MFEDIEYYENEYLKQHTTFKIGGYAAFFVIPKDINELKKAINICKKNNLRYFVLGNGSNVLASDEGFDGAIISTKKLCEISYITKRDNIFVTAYAGVNLFKLNLFLAENNISGLAWSYGIPGSIGGATKMNAGAFGQQLSNFITEITLLKNGKVIKLKKFDFSYRQSFITDEIILSVKLKLAKGKKEIISRNMQGFLNARRQTQPYDLPSAGSIFKRKGEIIPAKIIDELGLKGLRLGDAMISPKHAGFIVNLGFATSKDVQNLIRIIKALCRGIELEEEIVYLK